MTSVLAGLYPALEMQPFAALGGDIGFFFGIFVEDFGEH